MCRHTPLVPGINGFLHKPNAILRVNEITAFSQISANDVPKNIFKDEQSLDESNNENGKDIYGYLGAFVVPCGDLEGELRHFSGSRKLSNVDDNKFQVKKKTN